MSEFTAPSVEELQNKFPSHQIQSFIAQGGMGAVYLATQTSLERPVAIKILPQEFGEDDQYRTSFETEAKALARLNHSNLVGIYDFGDVDGMLFIIMEFVPGRSLFDTAHGQAVDQLEAARLIADMCAGLDHAHTAGMLHRDIKPANVLIDDEARPKIVDFGLARPLGEEHSHGVAFGTPGYTAPEVLTDPLAVDQRSDIFSMGVMLYELLTGQLPGQPMIPASIISGSDRRFDTILNKAIHPDPARRYHTAGEMSADLEALIKKFDMTPGLLATSAMARRPAAIGGRSMSSLVSTPVVMPTVMNSKSGSGAGWIIALIIAVIVGIIVYFSMSGDDEPTGISSAEIKSQQEDKALKIQKAEEKRLAEIKKRREAKKLKEQGLREKEERQAREREQSKREQAIARKQLEKEQQRKKKIEEERKRAMIAAEAEEHKEEVPEYDHAAFIEKERKDISTRAITAIRDHRRDADKILDRKEREVKRIVRREAKGNKGRLMDDMVEEFFRDWKKDGEKPEVPGDLIEEAIELLNEPLEEIDALDEKLFNDLSRDQASYAKELNKKLSDLEKENVTTSVEAIQEELDALDMNGYFLAIVESENPSPNTFTEEVEEDANGEKDENHRKKRKKKRNN